MITRSIILDSMKTVRENTIEVAKDIPADKYEFRPVEGYSSVIEQFKNVLLYTEFMTGIALYNGEINMAVKPREEWIKELTFTDRDAIKTKDDVITALTKSMDEIQRRVNAADEKFLHATVKAPDGITKVRLWIVQCAKEQEMNLRSQLFLFERMLGIVPHLTRRQMARQAAEAAAAGKK